MQDDSVVIANSVDWAEFGLFKNTAQQELVYIVLEGYHIVNTREAGRWNSVPLVNSSKKEVSFIEVCLKIYTQIEIGGIW